MAWEIAFKVTQLEKKSESNIYLFEKKKNSKNSVKLFLPSILFETFIGMLNAF